MSTESLPPRNKSQRLIDKKHKEEKNAKNLERFKTVNNIENPGAIDVLPGLNEVTDSFNAFPSDVIGYFTLLKEIDAKCVFTVPYLKAYIERFLKMKKSHPKRNLLLLKIRNCIKELMPCLEEKMHVATIASDTVNKHISRIDQFYNIVIEKEIPEIIRIGPMWDPCMKVTEPKTAQQQRSESRREALAAKKANKGSEIDDDINNNTDDNNSFYDDNIQIQSKKSNKSLKKETNQFQTQNHNHNENFNHNINHNSNNYSHTHSNSNSSLTKKRKVEGPNDFIKSNLSNIKKIKYGKSKKENKKEINNSDVVNSNHTNKSHLIQSANSKKGNHGASNSNNNNINPNKNINNNDDDNFNDSLSNNVSDFNGSKNNKEELPTSPINYDGEPVYCYCQQVSYGEMVGCDGANCEKEWFHLPCTGLKELPKGEWYCDECKAKM